MADKGSCCFYFIYSHKPISRKEGNKMALVTVKELEKHEESLKGLRTFSFEMGELYHILILGYVAGEKNGKPIINPVLFSNPTHNIRKDGKTLTVRCAKQKNNIDNVILMNEDGSLMKNPRTGQVLNDGSCPYCETMALYNKVKFREREKYLEENPGLSKDEIKNYTRELFSGKPVQDATISRTLMVAVFELDDKKRPVKDDQGNPSYNIMFMSMTPNRWKNKFMEQVELKKMGLEDENDDGIAMHEYYFKFPKITKYNNERQNKMESGKEMSISIVQNPVLSSNDELRSELIDKVEEMSGNFEVLEQNIMGYKLKTLEEMERDLAAYRSRINESMTEEEIKEVLNEIQDEELSEDDIKELADFAEEEPENEDNKDKEITEDDINKLL